MTLYVLDKATSEYKVLSTRAIKKMRRVEQVDSLCAAAKKSAPTMLALANWLQAVHKQGNKMSTSDLIVTRLPNANRIKKLADDLIVAAHDAEQA